MNSMSTNFTDDSKLGSISNSKVREVSQRYLKMFRTITGNRFSLRKCKLMHVRANNLK